MLTFPVSIADVLTREDVENHLRKGSEFLARGQLNDALTQYHAAIGWFYHHNLIIFDKL